MNLKSKLTSLHKSGKLKFIFVILLAGIVLLLLSGNKTPSVQSSLDGETSLEAKIRTLCESVDGVSSVNVAVSLDGDGESASVSCAVAAATRKYKGSCFLSCPPRAALEATEYL